MGSMTGSAESALVDDYWRMGQPAYTTPGYSPGGREEAMKLKAKKVFVGAGLVATVTLGLSASAWAAPSPNPNAPAHTVTACASVLSSNPNTGPDGHISLTGGQKFGAVGAAMCGLPT